LNSLEIVDLVRHLVAQMLAVEPTSLDDTAPMSLDSVQKIVLITRLEDLLDIEISSTSAQMFDSIERLAAAVQLLAER
jgi:acyl carrier protein